MAKENKPVQQAQPQPVDPVVFMRSKTVEELKALHYDLFAQKQQADHLYQMCVAIIREKQNPEPTKIVAQDTKTE